MSKYRVQYTDRARKQLKKLDRGVARTILSWIDKNLNGTAEPRKNGKPLSHELSGYWRYRVGSYRIVAEIIDSELVIIAVSIAHRSAVYKDLEK